jgi:hypothetical protein
MFDLCTTVPVDESAVAVAFMTAFATLIGVNSLTNAYALHLLMRGDKRA